MQVSKMLSTFLNLTTSIYLMGEDISMAFIQETRIHEYLEWFKKKISLDISSSTCSRKIVKRGHVYLCELGSNIGSELDKKRPCVILQRDSLNQSSPNTIVAPITHTTSTLDIVIPIEAQFDALGKTILDGNVLLGNIVTISKSRISHEITSIPRAEMEKIENAAIKSLGLYHIIIKYENIIKDKDDHIEALKKKHLTEQRIL
jgi:mRNA interferase MazF